MSLTISAAQLAQLNATRQIGNPAATWQLLASYGDTYAQAAYTGLANPTSVFGQVIRNSWNLNATPQQFQQDFTLVADQHLSNYLAYIAAAPEAGGTYLLPNSTQIEQSYYQAATTYGVSPFVAIDYSIAAINVAGAKLDASFGITDAPNYGTNWYNNLLWTGVGLEASRIGPPSAAVQSADVGQSLEHFALTAISTAGTFDLVATADLAPITSWLIRGFSGIQTWLGVPNVVINNVGTGLNLYSNSETGTIAIFDQNGNGNAYINGGWQAINSSNWMFNPTTGTYQFKNASGTWQSVSNENVTQDSWKLAYNSPPGQASDVSSALIGGSASGSTAASTQLVTVDYNAIYNGQPAIVTTVHSGSTAQSPVLKVLITYANGAHELQDYANFVDVLTSADGTTTATSIDPTQYGTQIGGVLGSTLGNLLGGTNVLARLGFGSVLSSVGSTLGEIAQTWQASGRADNVNLGAAIGGGVLQFPMTLEITSLNEVSGYLFGELISILGIKGEAAGLIDAVGGDVAGIFAQNVFNVATGVLVHTGQGGALQPATYFDNLSGPQLAANLGGAVGSYLGSQLAQAVLSPTTDGGQIGEQFGSALGGVAATIVVSEFGADILGEGAGILAYAELGAAFGFVGAFVGAIIGTLIGDVFGEAPSPQAYDNITLQNGSPGGQFVSSFRSQKDGGPTSTAAALAKAITTELNTVVQESGGTLGSSTNIPLFVVGVRKGTAELIDNHDHKFYGSNGTQQLINYAVLSRLGQLVIVGGDPYVKRAITATAAGAFDANGALAIDTNAIAGNIKVAQDYEFYIGHEADVNAVIAGAPQSAAALGWAAELTQALALGLNKRGLYDWNAGWDGFLKSQSADPTQVTFDDSTIERLITANGTIVHDTIDSTQKTIIRGDNSNSQTITVLDGMLQPPSGGTLTANGAAVTGTLSISVAAMIHAGNGTGDVVWSGNQGNDVFAGNGGDLIYAYSSATDKTAAATWVWGGTGNDTIVAGISSGDYLNGGAGNDSIDARATNSVWIDGGTGNNTLLGGAGNDVITAAGSATGTFYTDLMVGGGGTDTYIVNIGTSDTVNNTPAASSVLGGGTIELAGNVAFSQVGLGVDTAGNLDITVYAPGTNPVAAGGYTGMTGSNSVIETIVVNNWSTLADRVQYLQTSDGQKIDLGNFSNIVVGTAGNNYLVGTQLNDAIFGMGGTDTIEAFGGADLINGDGFLDGGTGNDLIFGGNANDTLLGGSGSNTLEGGAGSDLIMAGAFDSSTQTNVIQGGPGNDTLIGGSSTGTNAPDHNLFEYAAGDGSDLLVSGLSTSAWHQVWTSAGSWTADFARDLSTMPGDTLSGDITLTATGAAETWATALGLKQGTPIYYTQPSMVNGTLLAAGTMNGIVDIEDGISLTGTKAGVADSAIYWQPNLAQGAQTVSNANDTIQFGPSITPSELLFEQQGSNLLIGINDGNTVSNQPAGKFAELQDQITVENYFSTGAIGALSFQSASGAPPTTFLLGSASGTAAPVVLLGPTIDGGAQAVTAPAAGNGLTKYWITGAAPNTSLTTGAGDTLTGWNNADTLVAGAGNNLLYGKGGNDLLIAGSSGIDTLDGGAGADTLQGTGQTFASYADASAISGTIGVTAVLTGTGGNIPKQGVQAQRDLGMPGFWRSSPGPELSGNTAPLIAGSGPYTNTGDAAGDVYTGITGLIGSKYNDTLVAAVTGTYTNAGTTTYAGSTLDGGGGSDLLVGSTGNDDFVYHMAPTGVAAYGADTIQLGGGSDTIEIDNIGGQSVTYDNLSFSVQGSNLVIVDGSHTITVQGLQIAGQTLTISPDGDSAVTFTGLPISGTSGFAVGGPGASTINGGSAPTFIVGDPGNDVLHGMSGNDTFEGGPGADTITGTTVNGVADNTVTYAGSSVGVTVTLVNGAGVGTGGDAAGDVLTNIQNIVGSSGNDSLTGGTASASIDGGTGNDTIMGYGTNDVLVGNGVDYIQSNGAGDNALISVANCTLTGQGSTLIAGNGNATVYGGAGNDTLQDQGGFSSSLNGGAGNDYLYGRGNDTLDGGGGNDTIIASQGNSLLEDSGGSGILYALGGTDTLFGGAGNNTLLGGLTQNDILISDEGSAGGLSTSGAVNSAYSNHLYGAGKSWVAGTGFAPVTPPPLATGNDTFELSSQSGTTSVWANYGVNEIEFDTSVKFSDLVFVRDAVTANQLDIFDPALAGTPFEIELQNFFTGSMLNPSLRDITASGEVLFLSQFANSTSNTWVTTGNTVAGGTSVLTWEAPASAEDIITGPSNAANLLLGSSYNSQLTSADTVQGNTDTLKAGAGSNTIFANAANAVIYGGSTADAIYGGTGSNTVYGGSGAETITGNAAASAGATNTLIAGSGADSITGGAAANIITGGSGADTLIGGTGASTITGGSGLNVIFGGLGATSIVGGTGAESIIGGLGNDTIIGGPGAESIFGGYGSNLIIAGSGPASIAGGAGASTIDLTHTVATTTDLINATNDLILEGAGTDTIQGTEQTTVSFATLAHSVTINNAGATSVGDTLTGQGTIIGSKYSDFINAGNAAQASVYGGGGTDTLLAGSGNDTLENGLNDSATFYGYTGALTVPTGNDTFIVDAVTAPNSFTIYGGEDDDLFEIGSGNGTIFQAARSPIGTTTLFQDVIQIETGSVGSLSIYGPSVSGGATVSTQLSYVDTSVSFFDLWFSQSGNDLIVQEFGASGIEHTDDLKGWFSNAAIQSSLNLQYFTAGGNVTPDLLTQAMMSYSSNGSNLIGVNGLIALDAGLAQAGLAPTSLASANAIYASDTAYHGALQLLWVLDTPPTITLNGTSETVLEFAPANFSATVSDSLTVAPNLLVTAVASTGTVTSSSVNGNGGVTLTWSPTAGSYTLGPVSIAVTVEDGADVTSTATYTVNITPVDPAPVFTQQPPSTINMQENANGNAKGSYGPFTFSIDDKTPTGADDAGSVFLSATSSNQNLISNSDIAFTQTSPGVYSITLYSEAGQYGSSNITFSAYDGTLTTQSQVVAVNVAETAIAPTISVPGTQIYNESATSQTGTIFFSATDPNSGAITTVAASVGPSSWWLHPNAPTYLGNGQYEEVFTIDAGSWTIGGPNNAQPWYGSIVLTATSAQGNAGTLSTPATISIGSNYEHFDFGINPLGPITLPENSGVGVVGGIGAVTLTGNTNGDAFTYAITSGDPLGGANNTPDFSISNAGTIFVNNGISWSPTSNSYTLGIQVSNVGGAAPGGVTHSTSVVVNVTDNSPPSVPAIVAQVWFPNRLGQLDAGFLSTDPHGLSLSYKLTVVQDLSGMGYALVRFDGYEVLTMENPGSIKDATDTISITASDGVLSATNTFQYTPWNGPLVTGTMKPSTSNDKSLSENGVTAKRSIIGVADELSMSRASLLSASNTPAILFETSGFVQSNVIGGSNTGQADINQLHTMISAMAGFSSDASISSIVHASNREMIGSDINTILAVHH